MIKCKVCGCEFTPVIDKHYIARDNGESGIATAFKSTEGKLYDTFDCPTNLKHSQKGNKKRLSQNRIGTVSFCFIMIATLFQ